MTLHTPHSGTWVESYAQNTDWGPNVYCRRHCMHCCAPTLATMLPTSVYEYNMALCKLGCMPRMCGRVSKHTLLVFCVYLVQYQNQSVTEGHPSCHRASNAYVYIWKHVGSFVAAQGGVWGSIKWCCGCLVCTSANSVHLEHAHKATCIAPTHHQKTLYRYTYLVARWCVCWVCVCASTTTICVCVVE